MVSRPSESPRRGKQWRATLHPCRRSRGGGGTRSRVSAGGARASNGLSWRGMSSGGGVRPRVCAGGERAVATQSPPRVVTERNLASVWGGGQRWRRALPTRMSGGGALPRVRAEGARAVTAQSRTSGGEAWPRVRAGEVAKASSTDGGGAAAGARDLASVREEQGQWTGSARRRMSTGSASYRHRLSVTGLALAC
jgi:hypothetical protein